MQKTRFEKKVHKFECFLSCQKFFKYCTFFWQKNEICHVVINTHNKIFGKSHTIGDLWNQCFVQKSFFTFWNFTWYVCKFSKNTWKQKIGRQNATTFWNILNQKLALSENNSEKFFWSTLKYRKSNMFYGNFKKPQNIKISTTNDVLRTHKVQKWRNASILWLTGLQNNWKYRDFTRQNL